jgi:teichuronic acid biosynthesis glycosyltransferase TuaG
MALVSIVIPVYNAARFLNRTIESVQAQHFTDWEITAVIDGKSNDNSQEILEVAATADPRIKVHAVGTIGVVDNREYGIKLSSAPYLAFLDSDDWWHPEKLQRQLAFMQDLKAPLSCTAYYRMSEDGHSTRSLTQVPYSISYHDLLSRNIIGCLTAMIDRRACPDCSFPRIVPGEDYGLWLRLLRGGGQAYGLNEPLAFYREVAGSLSSGKWKSIISRWRILHEVEKLSVPRAAYFLGTGLWGAVRQRRPIKPQ